MMLSGFTFIRNAVQFDFPIKECIESMLPLVDELIINIGESDTETTENNTKTLIQSIITKDKNKKIKIIHSKWDDSLTEKGLVLSQQTNIALSACSHDWCLYLQADEAIHEKDFEKIKTAIQNASPNIEGFRFKYFHFYAGYNLIKQTWNWYPSEIRLIRKSSGATSFGDAQTFRKKNDDLLKTELLNTTIYHYGHARAPDIMAKKINYFHRFWHGDNHAIKTHLPQILDNSEKKELVWFYDSHPKVYAERVALGQRWSPSPQKLNNNFVPKLIVISCNSKQLLFAEALKTKLKLHYNNNTEIIILSGLKQWISYLCKHSLKIRSNILMTRHQNCLIDLDAETRNFFTSTGWTIDALAYFKRRIAHCPSGQLHKFKKKIYTEVAWGKHEVANEGFEVPQNLFIPQILKWLGIENY